MHIEPFLVVAARPEPRVEDLALSLAAEFREVDESAVVASLDELGDEVVAARPAFDGPQAGIAALREVLAVRHGFAGDQRRYDHPYNSMLDLVLERRRGLPILLARISAARSMRPNCPCCISRRHSVRGSTCAPNACKRCASSSAPCGAPELSSSAVPRPARDC